MEFTLCHLLLQKLVDELILVELIRSNIYDKVERIGNDVVLCTAFDNGD